MNLHRLLQQRAAAGRPVQVGLIGAGKFGSMFLSQVPTMPGLEIAVIGDLDPERAAAARRRFDAATRAVSNALEGAEYLVAGRFTVADVLVGTALAFTARVGFADELPANVKDYLARLAQRPAYQRAVERTSD